MPRGNFNEAAKGGAGFVDGYVLITSSVATVFQYPINQTTKIQSAPFPALVWKGLKLTAEWQEKEDADGNPETFEIVNRMGDLDECRPGQIDPKDFDNLEIDAEDLGKAVGTEGNVFFLEQDKKFSRGWFIMKESLEKHGFSPAILGRGVAQDFVGLMAHFKTEKGEKYIAKKGPKAGTEQEPSNLVCDRIQPPLPYEKGAHKVAAGSSANKPIKPEEKKPAGAGSASTGASTTNGAGATSDDTLATAKGLFTNFSADFKKEVKPGDTVKFAAFLKALPKEFYRQKITKPKDQTSLMAFIKDGEKLAGLVGEMMDTPGAFTVEWDAEGTSAVSITIG